MEGHHLETYAFKQDGKQDRELMEMVRNFLRIDNRKMREGVRTMVRALAEFTEESKT